MIKTYSISTIAIYIYAIIKIKTFVKNKVINALS